LGTIRQKTSPAAKDILSEFDEDANAIDGCQCLTGIVLSYCCDTGPRLTAGVLIQAGIAKEKRISLKLDNRFRRRTNSDMKLSSAPGI
jgi:hypothetical protein